MNSDQYKRMSDWLSSPEGQASIKAYAQELAAAHDAKERRAKKVNEFSDEEFEILMQRMEKENGDEWGDMCMKNGYEPYPTNILNLLFSTSEIYGKDVSDAWQNEYCFPVAVYAYRGYVFYSLFGQGVHQRVYRGTEIIISL